MEPPGAAAGGAGLSGASVPAFLTKLWTLVEDPDTDPLIRWSPSGTSFHVFDHSRFSKEVLPKFFKHNNMASFIRQLNMYGFRKVVHIEQGGLLKPETDDTEFQHPSFIRGQEVLLEHIKRKVTTVSSVRQEEVKMSSDDVNKILNDVQLMKGKQETIDSRIVTMKHENEALWREVASLRQKHLQQQKVVNKLIQFLVSLVQSNRVLGVKRKIPLMLSDSSSAHSAPKYSRPFSLEHMQAAASVFDVCDAPLTSEPILSDVTDVATPTDDSVLSDWMDAGGTRAVTVKAEPSSPELELCADGAETPVDTPFSPSTFINSILEEEPLSTSTSAAPAGPIVVMSPGSTGPPPPANTSQHLVPVSHGPTSPRLQQTCQTVACIDRPRPPPSAGGLSPDVWRFLSTRPDKSELTNHVESMDSSLESLQSVLNTPTFSFDTSPLMEFFSPSCFSGDFDVDTLDTLLCDDVPNGGDAVSAGKQLVQYTATPVLTSDPNLPSLLEAELEPFIAAEDPDGALLSHAPLDSDL